MNDFRIVAAGDSALLIELPPSIDPTTSGRVLGLARAVREGCGSSVRDLVVGYCSLTVYFDPLVVDAGWLESVIQSAAEETADSPANSGATLDVPGCHGRDLGPELAGVAPSAGCSQ